MRRYPLLPITVLYGAGVVAAGNIPIGFRWWLGLGIGSALLAWLIPRGRTCFIYALAALLGAALLACRIQILSPIDLRAILGPEPRVASVKGILIETPSYTRYDQNGREAISTSGHLRVTELSVDDRAAQPAEGCVLVTLPAILPEGFWGGREIRVEGVLAPPKGALAEGLFDYRKYLAAQRIYYQLQTHQTNDWKLAAPNNLAPRPFADRFLRWGQKITALGLPVEDEELHLLWAMTLGWRPGLTSDSSVPFIRTGTMHIFAISGLHVALIAAILVQLLRVVRIPRAGCALVVIPLIWLYTGLTGWQPSAIRSTIMSSIVVLGWSLKRPSNLLNSLLGSALIILIWQPEQLFQASFQLSFFVVLSMALLLPSRERSGRVLNSVPERLSRISWLAWLGAHPLAWREPGWKPGPFVRWWPGDELIAPALEPAWLRGHRWLSQFAGLSLITTIAAWIGSLPLIMYYFSIVTPVSLLANPVVVPLSSMALTCNFASLCTGTWFAGATMLFNHAGWFAMLCLDQLSAIFSGWRLGYFYTRQPTAASIVCYYLFLVLATAGCLARPRLRYVTVGVALLSIFLYIRPIVQLRNALRITVLPAGGGTLFIEDRPAGNRMIVDTADAHGAKIVVSPFLHAQGINSLDSLWLTHASVRHVGGIRSLLDDTPPCQVVSSKQRFRSRPYNNALRACETNRIGHLAIGDSNSIGRWRILHPNDDSSLSSADDKPVVFKGEYGGLRVLVLSELGGKGQESLLQRHSADLKSDIVIAGMPSHDEPLEAALLEAASPSVIVLCTSDYPAAARGNRKLRDRLEAYGAPVYYSDEAKAITIIVKPNQFRLETMSGETLQWKSGEKPKKSPLSKVP